MNIFTRMPQFGGAAGFFETAALEYVPPGVFDYVSRIRFWATVEGLDKGSLCWVPLRHSKLLGDLFELYVMQRGNLRSLSEFVAIESVPADPQELAADVIVRLDGARTSLMSLGDTERADIDAEISSLTGYCLEYETVRVCYTYGGSPP